MYTGYPKLNFLILKSSTDKTIAEKNVECYVVQNEGMEIFKLMKNIS